MGVGEIGERGKDRGRGALELVARDSERGGRLAATGLRAGEVGNDLDGSEDDVLLRTTRLG